MQAASLAERKGRMALTRAQDQGPAVVSKTLRRS
jgi:hypothetical protein